MQYVSDGLLLLLVTNGFSGEDAGAAPVDPDVASSHPRRVLRVLVRSEPHVGGEATGADLAHGRRAHLVIRVDRAHLLLRSDLSDTLVQRPHVNVSHLHSLVVVDVQLLVDHLRRALDSQ